MGVQESRATFVMAWMKQLMVCLSTINGLKARILNSNMVCLCVFRRSR